MNREYHYSIQTVISDMCIVGSVYIDLLMYTQQELQKEPAVYDDSTNPQASPLPAASTVKKQTDSTVTTQSTEEKGHWVPGAGITLC